MSARLITVRLRASYALQPMVAFCPMVRPKPVECFYSIADWFSIYASDDSTNAKPLANDGRPGLRGA
jgi:hypothetical protein